MGNHRFKLSDMMPNAWFYKLRDMSKVRSLNPSHHAKKNTQSSRKSSVRMDNKLCISPKFYDGRFPRDPPRKSSSKKRSKRKTVYMPSPSETEIPVWVKPGNIQDYFPESPMSAGFEYDDGHDQSYPSPCSCKLSSSATDITINIDIISELDLPPIQTKPGKLVSLDDSGLFNNTSIKSPIEKPKRARKSSPSRNSFSGGVKLRGNVRKSKKMEGRRRKIVKEEKKGLFYTESLAIVKASFDPEKDFKESMVEMIVENNIRASKDLEELLACYLSLNSNQYHDLIIKAFEQIWFNMPQLHF